MMKKLTFFFLLSICYFFSYSQEPGMKNYGTLEGLPSDEVYKSLIDDKGYLWFATNSGVCYFDGDGFTTLDISDGLIENTILEIELDKKGRIWFLGISGNLCYYNHGKIIPFAGNSQIQKLKTNVEVNISGGFIPIDTNEVIILFNRGKKIHIKDSITIFQDINMGDTIELTKPNNQYRFSFFKNSRKNSLGFLASLNDTTICYEFDNKFQFSSVLNYNLYQEYENQSIYFMDDKALIFYKTGELIVKKLNFNPIFTLKGIQGGLWIGTKNSGLLFFKNLDFTSKPTFSFLKAHYITSLRYDQNQRGWVTTLNSGVFNVQALAIKNYFLESNKLVNQTEALVKLDNGAVLAFTNVNKVYYFKDNDFKIFNVEELNNELIYKVIKYHDNILVATTFQLVTIPQSYFTQKRSSHQRIKKYKTPNIKDLLIQDSILWVSTSSGLAFLPRLLYDGNPEKYQLETTKDNRVTRIISYHPIDASPEYNYLIYHDLNMLYRLRYLKSNPRIYQESVFNTGDNPFITSINDIKYVDGDIILATKGRGLLWINDDSIYKFDKSDGLISNYIKKIEFDDDSTLILATNNGINFLKFRFYPHPTLLSADKISRNDGMRGNDVNDFILLDEKIIAATNYGVSYINQSDVLQMEDHFPIHILQFKVNGENIIDNSDDPFHLDYFENNVSISFNAIDFHDKENLNYFYRLQGGRDSSWETINKPEVVFPLLAAGDYNFEVKAQNSYGFWSDNIESIKFSINEVFYKKWWFRIGFTILFLGLLSISLIFYFAKRNEKLRNEKVLADFHQQSLTRLLNPHFMSNALNSVNSFIMTNKKIEATNFIKQIGEFIRQIYNSAYYKDISLKEETSLLTNYLKIEQRRSNSRFNFVIKVDKEIEEIRIPSFMIQLFVENSVLHGFSDLKPKGGLITVVFKKIYPYIYCEITDNGIGRIQAAKYKKSKSTKRMKHGLDIIEERIKLLNTKFHHTELSLKIVDLYSDKTGDAIGTRVLLAFPIIDA